MDAKKFLTNKSICTLPWHGFELEPNGDVKNCIISNTKLGNIGQQNIKDILHSGKNKTLKQKMLEDKKPYNCAGCYLQEKGRANLSSISSRLYYLKELANKTDLNFNKKIFTRS